MKIQFDNSKDPIMKTSPVPVHIAHEGKWKGYHGGFEVEFTGEKLDQMVENFNRSPIPLPIYRGHADTGLTITNEEAPNVGWVLGLKKIGKDLFGLCEFTKEAMNQIKEGIFKFASIHALDESIDRVSGEPIGSEMISLAITNNPFINDLKAISFSSIPKQNTYIQFNEVSFTMADNTTQKEENKEEKKPVDEQKAEEMANAVETEKEVEQLVENKVASFGEAELETLIQSVHDQYFPEMPVEEVRAKVCEMLMPKEEESEGEETEIKVETESMAVPPTDETKKEDESVKKEDEEKDKTPVAIAATNIRLSNENKNLKITLSNLQKENGVLKKKLNDIEDKEIDKMVDALVRENKITLSDKPVMKKLAKENREHFNFTVKLLKPSVHFTQLIQPDDKKDSKPAGKRIRTPEDLRNLQLAGIDINNLD